MKGGGNIKQYARPSQDPNTCNLWSEMAQCQSCSFQVTISTLLHVLVPPLPQRPLGCPIPFEYKFKQTEINSGGNQFRLNRQIISRKVLAKN